MQPSKDSLTFKILPSELNNSWQLLCINLVRDLLWSLRKRQIKQLARDLVTETTILEKWKIGQKVTLFYFYKIWRMMFFLSWPHKIKTSSKWEWLGICQPSKSKANGPDDPVSCLYFRISKDDNSITYLISPVYSISFLIHLPTLDSDSNPSHNTRVHDPFISCQPIQNKSKNTDLEWLFSHRSACSSKGGHTGHRHSLPLWEWLYVEPPVLLSPLLLHSPMS